MVLIGGSSWLAAQDSAQSEKQETLARIEQLRTTNRKNLAQYTWQQIAVINRKGKLVGKSVSQVKMAPDGTRQVTPTESWMPSSTGGGLIQRAMGDKRKDDIESKAEFLEDLAAQYTEVDPLLVKAAKESGNIFVQPAGPGAFNLVIRSLIKPNDSVTFAVDKNTEQITAINVTSYMDDPDDKVSITARVAKLPDGTSHVATGTINGMQSQLMVQWTNTNYQRLPQKPGL